MKRTEFLKEMKIGFGDTIKALLHPVIEEDVDKLSMAAYKAIGIKWYDLSAEEDLQNGIEQRFISGQPIIVLVEERNTQAFSGICPVCSHLLIFTPLYSTGKCLICDKEYNFITKEGSLDYTDLPVKKEKGRVYVGISNTKQD